MDKLYTTCVKRPFLLGFLRGEPEITYRYGGSVMRTQPFLMVFFARPHVINSWPLPDSKPRQLLFDIQFYFQSFIVSIKDSSKDTVQFWA